MPAASIDRAAVRITARILLAIGGGYATSAALVAVASVALVALGVARSDAVVVMSMLGYPIFLALGLWAFAARRLRTVAVVAGVGTLGWIVLI